MSIKRLSMNLAALFGLSLALAACSALSGDVAVPVEPLPTYTALPTYTPPPSPTLPPLPTATLPPLESPTVEGLAISSTPGGVGAGGGLQVAMAFFSYVREGPDASFKRISHVEAGETVTILGRDLMGFWLLVRTATGVEGWIKLTQFQSGIDVGLIPLATNIPTPAVTDTPTPSKNKTPFPGGSGTPAAPVATVASGDFTFNLTQGTSQCLSTSRWYLIVPITMADPSKGLVPFNPSDLTAADLPVFQLITTGLPGGLTVTVDGNVKAAACNSPTSCQFFAFTLCAATTASTPTGKFAIPVVLSFGKQNGSRFDKTVDSGIPTVFIIQ